MKKTLVIGSILLDIIVDSETLLKDDKEKPTTTFSLGGEGYNVAHTLTLFDVPTMLSCMYGQDPIGAFIQKELNSSKIELTSSNISEENTGIFVAVLDDNGDTIFDKSDTSIYQKQAIPNVNLEEISFILILSSTNKNIFEWLREVKKSFPDIVIALEIAGKRDIPNILSYLDIFDFYISNQNEAYTLCDALHIEKSNEQLLEHLFNIGIDLAIITSDATSVSIGTRNKTHKHFCIYNFPVKPLVQGNVVSTIGAGDSFCATFCSFYYFHKKSLEFSIQKAMKAAALVIQSKKPVLDEVTSIYPIEK